MTSDKSRPTKDDWLAAFDREPMLPTSTSPALEKTFWDNYCERFDSHLAVLKGKFASPTFVQVFHSDQKAIIADCFDIDFTAIMPQYMGVFHYPELIGQFRRKTSRIRSIMELPATAALYERHHRVILNAAFDGNKSTERIQQILTSHLANHPGQYSVPAAG
jgi:hypothetical protein